MTKNEDLVTSMNVKPDSSNNRQSHSCNIESWEQMARQQQTDSEEWIKAYVKKYLEEIIRTNSIEVQKTPKHKRKKWWRRLQKFVKKLVEDARLIDAVWMTITYWGTHNILVAVHNANFS